MSAEAVPFKNAPNDASERLCRDAMSADETLCRRDADLLKGMAKSGENEHLTVHIAGPTISVKREPPPYRWPVEDGRLRNR